MEPGQRALVAGFEQLAHQFGGAHKAHAVAPPRGLDPERDRDMRLAGADRPAQDQVMMRLDVGAASQLQELWFRDALEGSPVELLEGLDLWETGLA